MRSLWISFAIVVLAVIAAVLWLVATSQGLEWAVRLTTQQLEVDVEIDDIQGRLLGPMTLRNIRYRDEDGNTITVARLQLDWRPRALLDRTLHVQSLLVQQFAVQKGLSTAKDTPTVSLPEVRLPIAIAIDDAQIIGLQYSEPEVREPFAVESVQLRGSADREAVAIEMLKIRAQEYSLRADGRITPHGDYALAVNIDWSVQHPMIAAPLRGRSVVQGSLNRLETQSVFESPVIARLRLELSDVLEHPRWHGQVSMEPLDLKSLNEDWPPLRLSGELQGDGNLKTAKVAGTINSEHADWGMLSSALDVHWAEPELRLNRLDITRGGSPASLTAMGRVVLGTTPAVSIDLSGEWQNISYPWQGPAEWVTPHGRFKAKGDMDAFVVHIDGMLSAPGPQPEEQTRIAEKVSLEMMVQDLGSKPSIRAKAQVPYLRVASFAANNFRADIDLDTTDTRPSHVDVSIAEFQLNEKSLKDIQIRSAGRLSKHTLEILAKHHDSQVHIAGSGVWRDPSWTIVLNRFDLRDVWSTDWLLSSGDVRLTLAPTEADVQRACWRVFEGSVCLAGQWKSGTGWRADLDGDALSVSTLGELWRPEVKWTGAVSGRARLSADADNKMSLTAHLGSPEGSATLAADEKPLVLSYRDIRVDADINNNQLRGGVRGMINDHGVVRGKIVIDKLFNDTIKRPIEAELNAQFTTLDSLRAMLPDLGVEGGELDAQLNVGGDLAQPAIKAVVRIANAAVAVPQTGTRLEDIDIKLESKDDSTVDLAANARSGDGSLSATGTSQFIGPRNWNLKLRIVGSDVQAVNLPEAKVIATPDLELKMQPEGMDVEGVVRIDEATILPELAAGPRVALSPDVVIVREDAKPSAVVLQTHGRITIELGDDVNFAGYGLTGKLRGSVNIDQEPSRATLATGEITVADGVYAIYGRKLDISTGRLIFAGGPIDNPGIDARAVSKIDDVTVTAILRGTLRQPEFSLTSEPVMSDTDMLSYLVLGRPADQIGGGDATLLLNAASTLLPKGGAIGVTDRIKSAFGLETLAVESRQDAEQESRATSLVLGKYLTPRLYIAYAAGVASTLNVFRVRYELSKRWLLQTESSSQESGGDVLFRIER